MIAFILSIALISCNTEDPKANGHASAGQNAIVFNYNGANREYLLYKPVNLPANAPLVFVMHGYSEIAERYYNEVGFNQVADTAKFAVCYPQGESWTWDVTTHNSTDVGFLKALAQYLQTQHSLNPNKTFATGFSMSGAMSNLLALDATDIFKAVAPVAGFVYPAVWSSKNPQNPIPVFLIHGTNDQTVSIEGFKGGPSVQAIADYYTSFNNCQSTETLQFTTNTLAYHHKNGVNNNEVWYYKISGHGHAYPGDTNPKAIPYDLSGFKGATQVWRFFRKW